MIDKETNLTETRSNGSAEKAKYPKRDEERVEIAFEELNIDWHRDWRIQKTQKKGENWTNSIDGRIVLRLAILLKFF